jgi:DNA-binding MarR family transcriptional regulator
MKAIALIGRNINVVDKYFRIYLRNRMNPYGLNAAEATVLLNMYEKSGDASKAPLSGTTQEALIAGLHYDKGVMTRTMKSLEEKGYVTRSANPNDSRSYVFTLTGKGNSFKKNLVTILREWADILFTGVDEASVSVLEKALDTMSENAVAFCGSDGMPKENTKTEEI